MQTPVGLVALLRPSTRRDLLAATAVSSLVFTATPFLIPEVAESFDVGVGVASLISSMQLGGFVLGSAIGARVARPSRRLLDATLLVSAIAHCLSAAAPWFSVLLVLRFAGGLGLGMVAWMGWQEVFGDSERMGDLAVVGPVMGIGGAPLAALLADTWGADGVFLSMGLLAVLPLFVSRRGRPFRVIERSHRQRSRPLPVTFVILACLGMMTAGGSAVFVFGAAMGTDRVGLSALVVSLAFSANAVVGIPAARYRGERPFSGLWVLATAAMAVILTTSTYGPLYWSAIALWGFAFWAGVPGIYTLLADRSANPADRAGDAQAVMAAGRVVGPLIGGALVEGGSFTVLGIVAAAIMGAAGLTLVVVERTTSPYQPAAGSASPTPAADHHEHR